METVKLYTKQNPLTRSEYSRLFEIMEYSFPADEHRGFEEQYGEFDKDLFRSMCIGTDRICGFMNFWELDGFLYLEHFATAKECRNQGLGSVLLKELRKYAGNRSIILEVEPPATSDYAVKRISYYEQRGFFLNDYEYYQPPYNDGDEPIRLLLMSSPSALSREGFCRIRDILYRDAYETDGSFRQG